MPCFRKLRRTYSTVLYVCSSRGQRGLGLCMTYSTVRYERMCFARVHGSGSFEPGRPSMTASTYVRVVRPAHSIQCRVCVPARAHSSRAPHTQPRFLTPPPTGQAHAPALPRSRTPEHAFATQIVGLSVGSRASGLAQALEGSKRGTRT
jgi:hypothetical protein